MNSSLTIIFATTALGVAVLAGVPARAQSYHATLTDLYDFTGGNDGSMPNAPLAADSFHDLYGTTENGAIKCSVRPGGGCGAIFKLNAQGQLRVLYDFTGGADGGAPFAGPILVRGKLYGDTVFGGANGVGVTYAINADGTGFTTLHAFNGYDASYVRLPLLPAPAGGLYGIADGGGTHHNSGTVFLWEPKDTILVLHDFTGGADGGGASSLLKDSTGNLFGSTGGGGSCSYNRRQGCGVVFEINTKTRAFSVLYTFSGGADGAYPILGSIDANGTIYGAAVTTSVGGGVGVLFSLTPSAAGYQFSTGPIIHTGYAHDPVVSGPQPGPGGAMVGASTFSIYADRGGKTSAFTPSVGQQFLGPFTLGSDGTIYRVSPFGPSTGQPSNGSLFSFTLTKTSP